MSPFGSEDTLQNKYMKELFEVPENPWYNGGDGPAQNHRLGKALGHNKQGHQ